MGSPSHQFLAGALEFRFECRHMGGEYFRAPKLLKRHEENQRKECQQQKARNRSQPTLDPAHEAGLPYGSILDDRFHIGNRFHINNRFHIGFDLCSGISRGLGLFNGGIRYDTEFRRGFPGGH